MTCFFSQNPKHLRRYLLNLKLQLGLSVSYWKEKKLKMAKQGTEKYSNQKTKGKILFQKAVLFLDYEGHCYYLKRQNFPRSVRGCSLRTGRGVKVVQSGISSWTWVPATWPAACAWTSLWQTSLCFLRQPFHIYGLLERNQSL